MSMTSPSQIISSHGNTHGLIRYWTVSNLAGDSGRMYTGNPDVPDDVFSDVLKQISVFVRTKVMPRELEIMATDAIPADLRDQAAEMGLFGYAIPQEWGGLGLDLVQDAEVAMELGYTSLGAALDVRHQQRNRRSGASRVRHRRAEGAVAARHRLRRRGGRRSR